MEVDDFIKTENGQSWRIDQMDKKGKYPISAHNYNTRESICWTKDGYFESDKRDSKYNIKKEFRESLKC